MTLGRRLRTASPGIKVLLDPFRWSLFILMVINISRFHQYLSFTRKFRPALVLVVLTAAYAWFNPRYLVTGSIVRSWPAKVMAGIAIAACVSVPFGISMGGSATFILDEFSKVMLFGFLLVAALRHARDIYTFVWAYVIGCGFLAYLAIFVYGLHASRGSDFARIQGGYTFDSNDIGLVMLVGLVMTALVMQTTRGAGKMVAGVILVAISVTIARTGSRGAFLGLVCVGLSLLVMLKTVPVMKRVAIVFVTGIVLVLAAPRGYWDQMATMLKPSEDYNMTSETGRKAVYLRGLNYWLMNPVTGIGINNFARAEGTLSYMAQATQSGQRDQGIKWSAPHNSFLEAWVEMGAIGGGLFFFMIFGGTVAMVRLRKKLPDSWARGDPEEQFLYKMAVYLPSALIGFGVSGAFVSFAYLDLPYILAAYMAGLYMAVEAKLGRVPAQAAAARPRRGSGRGRVVLGPAPMAPTPPRPAR